jgi:carbamoyltransferase
MKHILGISAGFHDASVSVINDNGDVLFAGHSERYSKIKNDSVLHPALLAELNQWQFDTIAFYERPWMHNLQQMISGQHLYGPWTTKDALRFHLGHWYQKPAKREVSFSHHLSHAAAGFQTSPFERAAVVVIDAIGELDTVSIYEAWYDQKGRARYKKVWGQRYPHSIGLFYTAITEHIGLKPMEEEYITMGMSAFGKGFGTAWLKDRFIESVNDIRFKENLHLGIDEYVPFTDHMDLAASAQSLTETMVTAIMEKARKLIDCDNLVYMGGVALNCVANSRTTGKYFDKIWIMPNPGDSGSSLGAAALAYGYRLNWKGAFLGHNIDGEYPVKEILDKLITDKIVGVASGRAEFGPRALGNRSLLADPRGKNIKDRVNEIKRRQKFRPFAPVILAECAREYFDFPDRWFDSPYMQCVATCREPDRYPAICHVDQTSRVQTVARDGSGIRQLLEQWYTLTGCPMLLNTSLNVRGEPMVNNRYDAERFERLYGVTVCGYR